MIKTIGFLGCGNMGGAIARAVCKAADPQNVYLANRTAAKALEGRQSFENWTDAFLDILHQVQDNKVLVMNVYRSVSREQVEQYLYKLLDPMLRDFVERSAQGFTVQDADKQFVVDFYKYALVGMALEWIRRDMKEDPVRMTERLNVLLHGDLERALRRFRTDRSPADFDD